MTPRRASRAWQVACLTLLLHGLTLLGLLQLGGRAAPTDRSRGVPPLELVWVAPPPAPVSHGVLEPVPRPLRSLAPPVRTSGSAQLAQLAPLRVATREPSLQAAPVPSPQVDAMPEAPPSSPLALAGQGAPAAPAPGPRAMSPTSAAVQSVEPHVGARPDYAYNPPPDYPLAMREQGIGGVVWLRVWVDGDGRPGEIRLARGSGYRLLDDAAMRAVRHWRFVPARSGDQTMASWVEFPIRFALSG